MHVGLRICDAQGDFCRRGVLLDVHSLARADGNVVQRSDVVGDRHVNGRLEGVGQLKLGRVRNEARLVRRKLTDHCMLGCCVPNTQFAPSVAFGCSVGHVLCIVQAVLVVFDHLHAARQAKAVVATNVHRKELVLHRSGRILCVRIINLNFQGLANMDRHGAQHRAVSCQVVAQLVSGDLGARKCRRSVPDGVRRGSHRAASRVDGGSGSVRQRSRCRSLHLNLEGELDLRGVGGASLRVSGNTGVQGANVVEELGGGSLKRESLGDHAKGLGSSEVKL